ncbi:MAG: transcription antitermination factor NusB [Verrucomicrobiales bacterium]|nr:transcription antitermination factor NusB [Verrucomicrobiales bacterium]
MPKPSPRRDGREAALQFLFGHEMNRDEEADPADLDAEMAAFWEIRNVGSDLAREFAGELASGTVANLESIDEHLVDALENYKLERLTVVDRNLLRLAIFEIAFSDHIPPRAAINEAIEIAKRFGTEKSPKFVNGVLDRIRKSLKPDA